MDGGARQENAGLDDLNLSLKEGIGVLKKLEAVGLKLKGKDFSCTVCGNQRFIKETLVVKTRETSFFSSTPAPLLTCMICTGCGYAHPFMPQYALDDGEKEDI